MNRDIIPEIIGALLIFLFLYASVSKLLDLNNFQSAIRSMPYIGRISPVVALVVPIVEIGTCILLFIPGLRKIGLYISLLLLTSFSLYLVLMVLSSTHLPCSCGGVLKYLSWKQHIFFNLSFMLLAVIGIRVHQRASPNLLLQ